MLEPRSKIRSAENVTYVLGTLCNVSGPDQRGTSLNLNNLVRRVINPLLNVCTCGLRLDQHQNEDHDFKLDPAIPKWRGWHSFRRSLASNLYSLGVKPALIQAILRHADIHTTLTYCVEVSEKDVKATLTKFREHVSQGR